VRVRLYGVFGDNYVIAVASLANGRRVGDWVEIQDPELVGSMRVGAEVARVREDRIAKGMERRGKAKREGPIRLLPLSRNDRNAFEDALSCYNIPAQSSVSEILSKFDVKPRQCQSVTAPSFVKPEFYEYSRSPGYAGNRKVEVRVDPTYLLVSILGWVLTRLGSARVGKEGRVGVHVFPMGADQSLSVLPELLKGVDNIPGIYPMTAFNLWLASTMISKGAVVNVPMKVYAVEDAAGQSPAAINSGYVVDVRRILGHQIVGDQGVVNAVLGLTWEALSPDADNRAFAIRACDLLFEVIMGSKREEDLLYFANRELYSARMIGTEEKLDRVYKLASFISRRLAWRSTRL